MSVQGQTRTFRDVRLNVRFTPDKQTLTNAVRRSASCHKRRLWAIAARWPFLGRQRRHILLTKRQHTWERP